MSAVTKQEIVEALRGDWDDSARLWFADRLEEHGIAIPDGWVLVPKEPIAVLRREIGEDDWFDWTPVRPKSPEFVALAQSAQMDYCIVYASYAPEVKP